MNDQRRHLRSNVSRWWVPSKRKKYVRNRSKTDMSNSISLTTIQTNHITSLCKLCSNALVLVDTITFEWFRISNIIGHLFCSVNRPTVKLLTDPITDLFENNKHSNLILILSQSIPISQLNEICTQENFDSIILLTSSPSIVADEKNELEEHLFDKLQLKYLQFPFISITDSFFLTPTLIPYRLPSIETFTSLTNDKIKNLTILDDLFQTDEIKTIRIYAELLNTFMASLNAREDVFALGPLSHIIAREYTQTANIKQRRRSGENKIALLLIDRHLDLATPSSHQQDTLLAQIINILPNVRVKSSDGCHERTIDIKVDSQVLLKTPSKFENDFHSYLFGDMKRRIENDDAKTIFDNMVYSKSKVATTEVFTHLLESLIYNNLETKIKSVKVSAAAISACLEKFRQSPMAICKNYELLIMSCCLMQLMDSVTQNQKIERLIGLEKILVQALTTNAGPSPFSIILQALKEDLAKPEEQRQLRLIDYVILLVHIYSLAGNDVFYGKEEKDRTHKIIGKEILNDSSFTNTLRTEMKNLGFGVEIEHVLDSIYERLDLLLSSKRRYKHLSSLIVHGHDEQPNYRQSLLKQIFDLYKRCGNIGSSSPSRLTGSSNVSTSTQQEQLMTDIEHVPFDGFTDFFKSAARGFFGDAKPNLASSDYATIVIFIIGGVTSHEIQLAHEFSQQIKKQIIIGSSGLMKPEDILSMLLN